MLDPSKAHHHRPRRGWWLSDPASNGVAFGLVLHQVRGRWKVARTLFGSPAEKAGVEAGEILRGIDKYELSPGAGDMHELRALLLADRARSHRLSFSKGSRTVERRITKVPIPRLLEMDFDAGGVDHGYCRGCRTCRSLIVGAVGCSDGCPGDTCTIA